MTELRDPESERLMRAVAVYLCEARAAAKAMRALAAREQRESASRAAPEFVAGPRDLIAQERKTLAQSLWRLINREQDARRLQDRWPRKSIDALGLSKRTLHCLLRNDVLFISELSRMTDAELLSLRQFGVGMLREVREQLAQKTA
jgi:hypothetical protein